jgi:sugar lactone lactonase YvrE
VIGHVRVLLLIEAHQTKRISEPICLVKPNNPPMKKRTSPLSRLCRMILLLVSVAVQAFAQSVYTPYNFLLLAGGNGWLGGTDGTGSNARFYFPALLALDSSGNVYVADSGNNIIRKMTPAGVVTTLAGCTTCAAGSSDGSGTNALFKNPSGVAVDRTGNLYVADTGNHTIRQVTTNGVVTTVAGLVGSAGSADGIGSDARFNGLVGLATDAPGNLYVADEQNHTIRLMTPAGLVTTLAGLAGVSGSADGTGTNALFSLPYGIAVDNVGNVYVADVNNTLRKITPAGVVTTLAGLADAVGASDGTGSDVRFDCPGGVAVDNTGNLYVADSGNATIRRVTPAGLVTTLAGVAGVSGPSIFGGFGGSDMPGTGGGARFWYPDGIAVDSAGTLYVGDLYSSTILEGRAAVYTPYTFTTIAGNAGYGSADGFGSLARFNEPWGIAVDGSGNIYVSDYNNFTIRKVTPAGVVTTLAAMAGISGNTDGVGNGARFGGSSSNPFFSNSNGPEGLAVDSSGNVYVADPWNSAIRKVTPGGVVTTLASGNGGARDGPVGTAGLDRPSSVAVGLEGAVYFVEPDSDLLRKVTPDRTVFTVAGMAYSPGSIDGTNSTARFRSPNGVAVDGDGNIYVADTGNATIRKVTPAGVVTTLAGSAGNLGSADGTGNTARFYRPGALAVDTAGVVYVADAYYGTIRKVTPAGEVTTLAGCGSCTNVGFDGTGTNAVFYQPSGIAVDPAGNVVVADTYDNTVRKVTPAGVVTTLAGLAGGGYGSSDGIGPAAFFSGPSAVAADGAGNVYVADYYNNTIRKVTTTGVVTTLAGCASCYRGLADGTNADARFDNPYGLAADDAGNVYVADTYNSAIRKVTPAGVVTTLAGGNYGSADGTNSAAQFDDPYSVAVDHAGVVYVADTYNNTIRKITPAGVVTTLAGRAGFYGSNDGFGSGARFSSPDGIAVDNQGYIYVADTGNNTIRKVTPKGEVSTLAGCATCPAASFDGTGTNALFNIPWGIGVDGAGNVFVSENGGFTIRKVTPDGVVTTVGGLAGAIGPDDGSGSEARFGGFYYNCFFFCVKELAGPQGLAVDGAGNIYVADSQNNTIRKGYPPNAPPLIVPSSPGPGLQGGQFGFVLTGPPGQEVVVEVSQDLVNWSPVWTNIFTGPVNFTDPQSSLLTRRFYRARNQ